MALLVLFIFVLIAAFALVMVFTKPTEAEARMEARLAGIIRDTDDQGDAPVDILRRDTFSDVPLLNLILSRLEPAARLRKLITEAGKDWTVGRLIASSLLGGVVVAWMGKFVISTRPVLWVLSLVATILPFAYLFWCKAARLKKFNSMLPETLDLMARALKAGHSITAAIEMVAQEIADPVGPEFRRVFEEQNFGLPMRDALLNLAARVPLADVRFLVTAMLIQRETGGNLVEVLDKATVVLRERIRLMGQLRIHTAQGKLTGWILCILPFVVFVMISIVNPQYSNVLIDDSFGRELMFAGLMLMALGILFIRKIVNVKV